MTLIIAVRCRNGCMVTADKRTRMKCGGSTSYRDDFEKVVKTANYLIFNHGYNQIDDNDWKLKVNALTPDIANPIYARVLNEMTSKADKKAFYVFMNMWDCSQILGRKRAAMFARA